jgi:hypothetical protein
MAEDIVQRLREASTFALMDAARATVLEAAAEIERLRAEISEPGDSYAETGVHSSDLVQLLRREGYEVGPWRLRYAARQRHIPAPFKTKSGNCAWRQGDIQAIVRYFQNPRRQGRPKKERT